jgi:hypothetical protein
MGRHRLGNGMDVKTASAFSAWLNVPAKGAAQFLFRLLEYASLFLVEVPPGAIDIENQHGHCRAEWFALAPGTGFSGSFE